MRAFGIALLLVTAGLPVFADSMVARFGPAYPTAGVYVDVSGVPVGLSQVVGAGYTVTMDPDIGNTTRGVVAPPTVPGKHAVPITGDGTAWVGNYLSTGTDGELITINFTAPQKGLTFLWGSIDSYNSITFDGGATWITGTEVAALVPFVAPPIGSQVYEGSAYVRFDRTTPFQEVTFKSSQYAFEIADVRTVPDGGMTLMLLGGALIGLESLRRRYRV